MDKDILCVPEEQINVLEKRCKRSWCFGLAVDFLRSWRIIMCYFRKGEWETTMGYRMKLYTFEMNLRFALELMYDHAFFKDGCFCLRNLRVLAEWPWSTFLKSLQIFLRNGYFMNVTKGSLTRIRDVKLASIYFSHFIWIEKTAQMCSTK